MKSYKVVLKLSIDNVRAEIECVISVIQALQKLNVQSFTIEIGQVQLYKCIVKSSPSMMKKKEYFRTYIESKIMLPSQILSEKRN